MRLSLVFELLLIFVLLAFAASKSVKNQSASKKGIQNRNDQNDIKVEESSINKYCKCAESFCNCCRDFQLPYVNLDGPGCASLMYLNGDKMSVSLSFGRKVITNKTLSSRKPTPVCMPLPGGISKFCGRVYNIARSGEEFRACLGLELQSKRTVEAAVRVSCFKFGPRGVHSEPADPLPLVPQDEKTDEDDDDDDDDDDDFGLGGDEDDDDDESDLDDVNDVDSADYTGFSLLGEDLLRDLFGSSSGKKSIKHKKKQAPLQTTTTTKRPRPTRRPNRKPSSRNTTPKISTVKSTTPKIRPSTRRTRKPSRRRPTRRPTSSLATSVATENTISSSLVTSTTETSAVTSPSTSNIQTTERTHIFSTMHDETYQPVIVVTQRPVSTMKPTTFEDTGLQMSLAHITGQLSAMPASSIISDGAKDSGMLTTNPDLLNYERIQTITPKSTTPAMRTTLQEAVNDDMVQIVHSLDSNSEEHHSEAEKNGEGDESRAHHFVVPNSHYEGLELPKRKGNEFSLDDLDVLDLSEIGETVGDQLGLFGGRHKRQHKDHRNKHREDDEIIDGSDFDVLGLEDIGQTVGQGFGIFGRKKRQNKHKETKEPADKEEDEYDMLETIGETLILDRSGKKHNKRDRRRQNKMMRGDWSQV